MPTLWGFMEFNYTPTSEVGEVHTEPATVKPATTPATTLATTPATTLATKPATTLATTPATTLATKPALKAATWEYPDDCFYIKMYVLCPLSALQTALGPCHRYDDEKKRGVWAWA